MGVARRSPLPLCEIGSAKGTLTGEKGQCRPRDRYARLLDIIFAVPLLIIHMKFIQRMDAACGDSARYNAIFVVSFSDSLRLETPRPGISISDLRPLHRYEHGTGGD